ncbi:MAG: alkaline phosphatase, partial [Bacteroidales bacterium]|nr:alkaline phosphatase [Bacteroidales bacterium]
MKAIKTSTLLFCLAAALFAQEVRANTEPQASPTPIRNVIVMIPDGCSTELLALGRWMNGGLPLALDSRIRGLVRTYCSDSPIGDSAPTGSTYATGHRSQDGFIATYPARSMNRDGIRFDIP